MPKIQLAKKLLATGMSLAMAAGAITGAVAVSAADSTEPKVLFEENFSGVTQLSGDWKNNLEFKNGKISVEDGALIVDGTGNDSPTGVVYLGKELMDKGDYTLEYDYTPLTASSVTRWSSGMFRVSGTTPDNSGIYSPYYHFTVRMNAATQPGGGVELTLRPRNASWKQYANVNSSSDLELGKTYRMKVIIKGGHIQEYIGDELVIDKTLDTSASDYVAAGGIGFQTSNMKIKIDNIKVTETQDMPVVKTPGIYNVYEPETKLAMAPTVLLDVKTQADYNKLTGKELPATAIFHLDASLNVVDTDGKKIATLAQALEKTGDNIIPGFYLSDKSAITNLKNYVAAAKIVDATIFSDDADVLTEAHKAMNKLRTALDFKLSAKADQAKLDEMIAQANKSTAKIMIMDDQYITKQDIEYMQVRMMTVWTRGDYNAEGTYGQVVKGPDGIITGDFLQVFDCYKTFTAANSLVRTPFTVGHRGYPNLYPENTMLSYRKSVEAGATIVETDIHMTKDGVIVICHDERVDRTTNGTGDIRTSTWDQLKDLKCKNPNGSLSDEGLPTIDDFLQFLKDNPKVVAYVELKDGNTAIVEPFKKKVAEYGVASQICTISFYYDQAAKMRQVMPETSIGYLGADFSKVNVITDQLMAIINSNFPTETTWHPNRAYSSSALMEMAKHRGIIMHPWTYTTMNTFNSDIRIGVQNLTSNSSEWLKDMFGYLKPEGTYELKANIASKVTATGVALNGDTKGLACQMTRIGGDDITFTNYDNGTVAANKEGTATVLLSYKKETFDGNYTIYSEPVTVTVGKGNTAPTEPPKTSATTTSTTKAPDVAAPSTPGMIREINFGINNAASWLVKDMKADVKQYVSPVYAVYPEVRVTNDENGSLVLIRAPFAEYPWANAYGLASKNAVNLVDNKLYFDFTADCQWNFNLYFGTSKNADQVLTLASYMVKEVNGTTIGYTADGAAGTYKGSLDIKAAYEDAVKQGQIKSGLINADGSANVYCLLIWSVSGTEDADKIVVRDAYIGREGTEPTATEPTATEPTGTEPTGTEPTGTETTNTGATDTNGSVIEPTNTNGSTTDTTSKTGDSPMTGDNMAVAMVGAMVLAASAGLLVFSRKKA